MNKLFVNKLLAITLFTIMSLLGTEQLCYAVVGEGVSPQSTETFVENQTNFLSHLAKRYQKASATQRQELLSQLVSVAKARQKQLAKLMVENPGAVLRVALPASVLAKLPSEVLEKFERRAEMEGTLEVIYEDYEDQHILRHYLVANNERFSLHFKSDPSKLTSGTPVRVRGVEVLRSLAIESGETDVQTLELGGDGSANTTSAFASSPLSNTMGEQRTLVILANFQNKQDEPYTVSEAQELVFGTVNDFYMENSYGQTWLSGDVLGWYTLPFDQPTDSATCKTSEISRYAQEAAQNAGVNLADFNHYVYVFPQTPCFPSGSGTVGGNPSESWINGNWFKLKTVGHELGHNLGLFHSGSQECGDTTLGIDCQTFVYGDTMDIMGNQSVGHFNTFQKERLGWLAPNLGHILTVDTNGAHTVEAYEPISGSSIKSVKVLKGVDPVTGEKSWYYVEYRQAVGFDDFLAGNSNVLNGVVIRTASESDPGSSVLLDMTPNSSATWDWGDPALEFGQSFTDPEAGLTITSQPGNGSTAVIGVNFETPSCVRANPTITTSPSESQWVSAGTPVTYTVAVTNVDSAACSSSSFDLTTSLPVGWFATYDSQTMSLEPGASGTASLEVTSSPVVTEGFYPVEAIARNSIDPAYQGSVSFNYVVSAEVVNAAPVAVDDSAETPKGKPVVIDLLSNDIDPDNDLLVVTQVTQGSLGSVSVDSNGNATYTPKRKAEGLDSFAYTITDGAFTASATVQVSITASISRGGRGKKK